MERHQGRVGIRVGRTARSRCRRRLVEHDELDPRRRVPALRDRARFLHPRELLRPRSPPARHGRTPLRPGPAEPAPRRTRLPEALHRLPGGDRDQGCTDGHPREDDQGVDARVRVRGAQLDTPDQEDDRSAADGAARPAAPGSGPARLGVRGRPPPVRAATSRFRHHPVPARSPPCARRPVAVTTGARPSSHPDARRVGVRRTPRRLRRTGGLDDDSVHPSAAQPVPRPADRSAHRADHPRRGPHLRHGRPVQGVRHLLRSRSELRARRPRPAAVLQGVDRRPDPRGGHQRGRWTRGLDRSSHQLRPPRRADDPVLHLLFDVRVPACRGPDLGRGGCPRSRVPDGCDRRTHHAARRRTAAPGRPQPGAVLDSARMPLLRPCVRVRDRAHRQERARAHVPRRRPPRRRGRLLLHHPVQRELPDAPQTGRPRQRGIRRHHHRTGRHGRPVPIRPRTCDGRAERHRPVLRHRAHRDRDRTEGARRALRRRRRAVVRDQLPATPHRSARDGTLEPTPPRPDPPHPVGHRTTRPLTRPHRRRHRLHASGPRPDLTMDAPPLHDSRHRRLRPIRHT